MNKEKPPPQVTAWGSYDRGKPRVRLLLDALDARGMLASRINVDVWQGVEDKSVVGWWKILGAFLRLVMGYPGALIRFAATPRDRIILLPYLAVPDIFIIWLMARLRGQKIVFDALISLYDTIVCDRKMLRPSGLLARWLWHIERLALRLADVILVDTDENGRYLSTFFRIPHSRFVVVAVGAEPLFWEARDSLPIREFPIDLPPRYVLFYGQFIPLHGIETILEAARLTEREAVHWLIIGSGQEEPAAKRFVAQWALRNLTWLPWVEYETLPHLIRSATVSLGIFGATEKAGRVIPNKMFQILAAGGSIITRESPAVTALAERFPKTIRLVPPADANALAKGVAAAFDGEQEASVPASEWDALSPERGVDELLARLDMLGGDKK